jgi:hypothetical protein
VNKLVELLSMSSPYARATYTAKKVKHVLICGTITPVCVCVYVCVYLPYPKMTRFMHLVTSQWCSRTS